MLPSLTHPTPTACQLNGSGVQAEYFVEKIQQKSSHKMTRNRSLLRMRNIWNMKRDQTIKLYTDASCYSGWHEDGQQQLFSHMCFFDVFCLHQIIDSSSHPLRKTSQKSRQKTQPTSCSEIYLIFPIFPLALASYRGDGGQELNGPPDGVVSRSLFGCSL